MGPVIGANYLEFSSIAKLSELDRMPLMPYMTTPTWPARALIAQSRAFYRNNAIYRSMIDRIIDYVIGDALEVDVNDEMVQTRINNLEPDEIDARGLFSYGEMQRTLLREYLLTGEAWALLHDDGKVQIIESERVDTVVLDDIGRITTVKIALSDGKPAVEIPAQRMAYMLYLERPTASRGYPPLQSVFPFIHRLNDIFDSEALNWQLSSRIIAVRTRPMGQVRAFDEQSATIEGEDSLSLREMDYAIILENDSGERTEPFTRSSPSQSFKDNTFVMLQHACSAAGIPIELLLADFSHMNFSSSKALMRIFTASVNSQRKRFFTALLKPIIENYLVRTQSAQAPTISLISPRLPVLDDAREMQAILARLDRGLTSQRRACEELGLDYDEMQAQRKQEIIDAILAAQDIAMITGEPVPYEVLAGFAAQRTPDEVNIEETTDDSATGD
jgi:capsid protein